MLLYKQYTPYSAEWRDRTEKSEVLSFRISIWITMQKSDRDYVSPFSGRKLKTDSRVKTDLIANYRKKSRICLKVMPEMQRVAWKSLLIFSNMKKEKKEGRLS